MKRQPTFSAIIGHADDPEMLRRCIVHHLQIGVGSIFVSLNDDDPMSEIVAREFASGGQVRSARVETFAADPFHYFTAAKDVVMAWSAPDWLFFVDSDEFWTPVGGQIAETAGLDDRDLMAVPRYNAVPLRERDGTVREIELSDPWNAPVIGSRRLMDADYLARNPNAPWIMVEDARKIMARPELVREVGRGAHDIVATIDATRWAWPDDLLIVHVPFTTEARFRRKVAAIRARLTAYGHRFGPTQAWHWRRWLEIDDAGGLAAEFALQLYDAHHVPALLETGELTTPARLLGGLISACG